MFQDKTWPSWKQVRAQAIWGAEDPEAGDPPAEDPPADDPPEPKSFGQDYVDDLRKESASHRIKRKEAEERASAAEAKLKEIADAELSEIEKRAAEAQEASDRATKAEAVARNALLTLEVVKAATKLNFLDPTDAQAMLTLDNIEFDEDGSPDSKSIKTQLEKLAKAKPYLLGEPAPGDGDGGGNKKPPAPKDEADKVRQKYDEKYKSEGFIPIPGA